MRAQPVAASQNRRVVAGLPFVEALARRMAASMPNSIDVGDLVQDGVLGLIDAAHRFDEDRGIKFETFAERRVRGAMIDALRRDAWPRGVRRQRRELDAARESLRRELGHEPSLADLAARVGSDENAPDTAYEKRETRERVLAAIASLPWRERKVIGLYYYGEVTMKQIGSEIGVNESRVSQLHARAIRRLRDALGQLRPQQMAEMRKALLAFASRKLVMAKAALPSRREEKLVVPRVVVLPYKPANGRATPVRAAINVAIKVTRPRHAVVAVR